MLALSWTWSIRLRTGCVASALLLQAFTSQVQLQHVFEIRELEEMTEEWLVNKLARN